MQNTPFPSTRTLKVGDQSFEIRPVTIDDIMVDLQSWVDSQFPDPFDVVNAQIEAGRRTTGVKAEEGREPYPMAVQQFMIRTALDMAARGRRLIGTPEADEKVQSAEGVAELLFLSIRKGDPGFTRESARELYRQLSLGQVAAVFNATNLDQVMSDPKSPGIDGTATA